MCWLFNLFKIKCRPREKVRAHQRRCPSTGERTVRVNPYKRRRGRP